MNISEELSKYLDKVDAPKNLHSLNDDLIKWFQKTYKVRIFPDQKVAGDFGIQMYQVNPVNPIGLPFVRINGTSAFLKHYPTFFDALDGGMVFYLKEVLKINLDS